MIHHQSRRRHISVLIASDQHIYINIYFNEVNTYETHLCVYISTYI